MAGTTIGIEIGGTKLQLLAADESGRITARVKLGVESARGAAGIRERLEAEVPRLAREHRAEKLGVGFGGPVDWRTGRIARSHQVEGWSGFDLAGWLGKLSGASVRVDNDANVAALGEARRGAGAGFNPVFYVTLGSGVGGGLVVEGRIYHGTAPGEAEIGHIRLDRTGATVESRCSGWAVDRKVRKSILKDPGGMLAALAAGATGGEARHLAHALQAGDPAAQRILRETAQDLGFGLSHVVHLFHPEIIILGGGLSLLGEPLRAAVQEALPPNIMEVFQPGPRLALAALGEDEIGRAHV